MFSGISTVDSYFLVQYVLYHGNLRVPLSSPIFWPNFKGLCSGVPPLNSHHFCHKKNMALGCPVCELVKG